MSRLQAVYAYFRTATVDSRILVGLDCTALDSARPLGSWALGERDVPNIARVDVIEGGQPVQLSRSPLV
jgi:hypothetical protein